MEDYIPITTISDFLFCPYSIYLHNVYKETDDGIYKAIPQERGTVCHSTIDKRIASNRKDVLVSFPVYSEKYHLMGKIDLYYMNEHKLVERKYSLPVIYLRHIYQLWAQMFCLEEMGYQVDSLFFYETSKNKMIPFDKPTHQQIVSFEQTIQEIIQYNPSQPIITNISKCRHCIYCNLCDKTEEENVYE